MTVFSWRVNGLRPQANLEVTFVTPEIHTHPSSPAAIFSDGMTPVVRPSLREMMQKVAPRRADTSSARSVSDECHTGSSLISCSMDASSKASASLLRGSSCMAALWRCRICCVMSENTCPDGTSVSAFHLTAAPPYLSVTEPLLVKCPGWVWRLPIVSSSVGPQEEGFCSGWRGEGL